MGYVSKVKLPSNNIYQIKDKEGRVILGFSDWQASHSYNAGEYVLTSVINAGDPQIDGERKLYKVIENYTSDTSSRVDIANGKLLETTVEAELQSAMAGGVGVVHTTGDESIGGTKTFTANTTKVKNLIVGDSGNGYISNSATEGGARVEFSFGGLSFRTNDGSNTFTATVPFKTGTIALTSDIPTAGTTATAVSTTSSGGSASTWSKSDHVHSISVATGDSNGQVKIAGQNVSVKGLGSNAYTSTSYIPTSQKGTASGVATLDATAKIPLTQLPDTILGQVVYGGTVNGSTGVATLSVSAKEKLGVTANTITLTASTTATTGYPDNEGIYYIVTNDGDFSGLGLKTGDWLISTGTKWTKIDNTDAVASVNGKTGVVTIGTTTTNLSASVSGGSVALTDGSAITYGSADVGTAVNVGTSLTGTTSFNTDAIKSASCSQSFLTSGLASASLTGTKTFATGGVVMSIDSTDTEMLVFGNANTGTVGISTTAASPTAVSISTTAATKASVSLGKTSITPAKASTKTFTPKTGATLTAPTVTITSGASGDVQVVTGLN